MKKGFFIVGGVILALVASLVVPKILRKPAEVTEEQKVLVGSVSPENRDIFIYTEQIGTVSPEETVSIIPKVSGEVLAINYNAGDKVNAGDILATIKDDSLASLKIQMDTARIGMNDASTALQRTRALFDTGAVSKQALEQAESAANTTRLAYQAAKNQYELQNSYANLSSPITGVIEAKNINLHDIVSPGNPAFTVSAEGAATLSFGVSEEVMNSIEVGDEVTIEKNNTKYSGKITEISTAVSQTSGLYTVKASIEDSGNFANGSKVKLSFIKSKARNVMTVPMTALYYSNNVPYVYLFIDGKAVKKEVKVGINDGEFIEIKEGISSDDKVISTWSKELYDGANVSEENSQVADNTDNSEESVKEEASK